MKMEMVGEAFTMSWIVRPVGLTAHPHTVPPLPMQEVGFYQAFL